MLKVIYLQRNILKIVFYLFQSRLSRPRSGSPHLERHVDDQPEELEKDFEIDFTLGSMETEKLQGQVRSHPLRQPKLVRQSGDKRHRRTRRNDDDNVERTGRRKAAETARSARDSSRGSG
jgi:hypothetical protein